MMQRYYILLHKQNYCSILLYILHFLRFNPKNLVGYVGFIDKFVCGKRNLADICLMFQSMSLQVL